MDNPSCVCLVQAWSVSLFCGRRKVCCYRFPESPPLLLLGILSSSSVSTRCQLGIVLLCRCSLLGLESAVALVSMALRWFGDNFISACARRGTLAPFLVSFLRHRPYFDVSTRSRLSLLISWFLLRFGHFPIGQLKNDKEF